MSGPPSQIFPTTVNSSISANNALFLNLYSQIQMNNVESSLDKQKHVELVKPEHSYIGLIAKAILSSKDKRMLLSEIYDWIGSNYSYFKFRGSGWRNSIRHNLSLNECFLKEGRAPNGKGHFWTIHPANLLDFARGDFRRKHAQWRIKSHDVQAFATIQAHHQNVCQLFSQLTQANEPKKPKSFDVNSLLATDIDMPVLSPKV